MKSEAQLDERISPAPLLRGLARNPASPIDVLLRLVAEYPEQVRDGLRRRRDIPPPLRDAMLRHPSPRIRGALATHVRLDPETRAVLLADPDYLVRMWAFGRPGQRPVPDAVLVRLLAELDDPPPGTLFNRVELLSELFHAMRYDRHLIGLAAAHPRPGVRGYAAGFLDVLDEPARRALLDDEAPEVRQAVAAHVAYRQRVMKPADLPDQQGHAYWQVLQRPLSRALVDKVLAGGDVAALGVLGGNPTTPPDVVDTLLRHADPAVRGGLAGRVDLTDDQLARLAADPAVEVRTAVSVHPGLAEWQRAGIDIDVTTVPGDGHFGHADVPCSGRYPYGSLPELVDSIRWARSVNPLLRRRAARDPRLPAELVALLADDPDLGVRVLLAQHHPAAPPALLLRCYLEYRSCDRCGRDQLSELPQFPTEGLARFADDPDPAVRRLVALDPYADPTLVDRLSADPDAVVRQAMASCPRLPVPRIVVLLNDPELAEDAAANPALPVGRMRRILGGDTVD
ncbi:hypothetical protein ACNTMW_03240 [Planosporangium sp. 12N6]|uniref:hypothetical protein n=1 Tax=Planosporangium spinosum TaxID=3402278 RepID=UPI003CFA66FA